MKTKLAGLTLLLVTIGVIAWYPKPAVSHIPDPHDVVPSQAPVIDVVFVLDTTGSMSGLIQTAKDKIWSIASTMAAAQPAPEIRIGLVGYRDRGDAYVTKRVDLNDDLDAVYAELMKFQADGGGDAPESVNQALYEAVHNMSWSQRDQAYQVIFLVGDAPPHMDYNEVQYPATVAAALEKGIVVNTIQCGNMAATAAPWNAIASLGNGNFFQVEQAGGAVALSTPYDEEIAELSAQLDGTRLFYGSEEERDKASEKVARSEAIASAAPLASRARRGVFNTAESGRKNFYGDKELVDAVSSGAVDLDALDAESLPEPMQSMTPEEQNEYVGRLAGVRADLQARIRQLADERKEFLEKEVEEAGGFDDSLDHQLFETVRDQAGKVGFDYESTAPSY